MSTAPSDGTKNYPSDWQDARDEDTCYLSDSPCPADSALSTLALFPSGSSPERSPHDGFLYWSRICCLGEIEDIWA
eukprot:883327-Amphidinium_carterae.1